MILLSPFSKSWVRSVDPKYLHAFGYVWLFKSGEDIGDSALSIACCADCVQFHIDLQIYCHALRGSEICLEVTASGVDVTSCIALVWTFLAKLRPPAVAAMIWRQPSLMKVSSKTIVFFWPSSWKVESQMSMLRWRLLISLSKSSLLARIIFQVIYGNCDLLFILIQRRRTSPHTNSFLPTMSPRRKPREPLTYWRFIALSIWLPCAPRSDLWTRRCHFPGPWAWPTPESLIRPCWSAQRDGNRVSQSFYPLCNIDRLESLRRWDLHWYLPSEPLRVCKNAAKASSFSVDWQIMQGWWSLHARFDHILGRNRREDDQADDWRLWKDLPPPWTALWGLGRRSEHVGSPCSCRGVVNNYGLRWAMGWDS